MARHSLLQLQQALILGGQGEELPGLQRAHRGLQLLPRLLLLHGARAGGVILLRVECANPTPVISIADGSMGVLVDKVEMRSQLSPNFTSDIEVNNALYAGAATGFVIRNSVLEEDPARPGGPGLNGSAQNPQPVPCYNTGKANFVFFLAASSDGIFQNNSIHTKPYY